MSDWVRLHRQYLTELRKTPSVDTVPAWMEEPDQPTTPPDGTYHPVILGGAVVATVCLCLLRRMRRSSYAIDL